ncbi:subtilase family-domain-containing protein [Coemansia spiralis]|nr:subtilase family-domain-containing protein [Coemansia spiralis]
MSLQSTPASSLYATAASTPHTQFPTHGLLPRADTQAGEFVRKHPTYDGRGTVVAVLDTGICPGAQGLQLTSDGKRKVLDFIDCTGSGDVAMSDPQKCNSGALELRAVSGRMLRLNPAWSNPSGEWRIGAKHLYDIAPIEVKRVVVTERGDRFRRSAQQLADTVSSQLADAKRKEPSTPISGDDSDAVAELDAQTSVLNSLSSSYADPGPILDCVVFHDGTQWRAAIDTEETGDLSAAPALGAYKSTGDVALLCKRQLLYYTINFYDSGRVLSIVTSVGPHSTHVAGILAANHPDEPQNNGVAPGAQLISLMIGDSRVASMETGVGLTRAVAAIIKHGADLANVSYGEPSATHNAGQWVQMVRNEVVRRHRCIFVSSAGNEGPALSTVGAPGGTVDDVIGVGAYVGYEQIKADYGMYDTVRDTMFTWSSRGPTFDGARGADIYAPGSAVASFPAYTKERLHLLNGTSMSSPNLCGCLALLVSAWKQEFGVDSNAPRISPYRVKNAIFSTAKLFGDELGAGLVQTDAAWQFLKSHNKRRYEDVEYKVSVLEMGNARGIYLRNPEDSACARHLQIKVSPVFPEDARARLECDPDGSHGQQRSQTQFDFEQRVLLVATVSWVRVPEALYLSSQGQMFSARVDATHLEPGHLHVASIDGYDSANVDRGPIFTIPVTVTKPLEVSSGACVRLGSLRFQPTEIVRRFIAVPNGATSARITIHSTNNAVQTSVPAMFYLHCVQISPQERVNTYEIKERVRIGHPSYVAGGNSAEQQYDCSMDVLGGATLEVCIAKFWNQLDSHEVDVTVDFHGIVPAGAQYARAQGDRVNAGIVVNGNNTVVRTDFSANLRQEYNIKPDVSLDTLRIMLNPHSATIAPMESERDIHPAYGVAIKKLVLDYKLETKSDNASFRPRLPALDSKIYESWADSFALAIYDANKRRVAVDISYTRRVTLNKRGDYLIRVQVRHHSTQDLEALKNMPLLIDMQLTNKISLPAYYTLASMFTKSVEDSSITVNTIARGSRLPLFFKTGISGLPAEASPGDVLYGSLSLNKLSASLALEYIVPAKSANNDKTGDAASPTASDNNLTPAQKDRMEIEEAIRKLRIDWIKRAKDDEVREQLVTELLSLANNSESKDEERAAVLSAQLDTLDSARKTQLPWNEGAKMSNERAKQALEIADRIISLTQGQALTARLYENASSEEDKRLKRQSETAKGQLVIALTTRCRALAFLTTQAAGSTASSEASVEFVDVVPGEEGEERTSAYEKAVGNLKRWTSEKQQTDDAWFLMATMPLLIAKQKYGQALQSVLKWLSKAPLLTSNTSERKAMMELRDVLVGKLRWTIWADHFRAMELVENPASYDSVF